MQMKNAASKFADLANSKRDSDLFSGEKKLNFFRNANRKPGNSLKLQKALSINLPLSIAQGKIKSDRSGTYSNFALRTAPMPIYNFTCLKLEFISFIHRST